jgi:hypothetical protein
MLRTAIGSLDCDTAPGIALCDDFGNIVDLNLTSASLSGSMAPEIGLFSTLEVL